MRSHNGPFRNQLQTNPFVFVTTLIMTERVKDPPIMKSPSQLYYCLSNRWKYESSQQVLEELVAKESFCLVTSLMIYNQKSFNILLSTNQNFIHLYMVEKLPACFMFKMMQVFQSSNIMYLHNHTMVNNLICIHDAVATLAGNLSN